ncbi:hypothetical protein KAR91_32905 [Candidatus Pacearchaeota archaeon]|nr:hypothetical protein [Candidatus Pacearchaeota archaeon]
MKEIKNWSKAIQRSLVFACLMLLIGCAEKIVIVKDDRELIPHPTMKGYQCISPGYLKDILDEFNK